MTKMTSKKAKKILGNYTFLVPTSPEGLEWLKNARKWKHPKTKLTARGRGRRVYNGQRYFQDLPTSLANSLAVYCRTPTDEQLMARIGAGNQSANDTIARLVRENNQLMLKNELLTKQQTAGGKPSSLDEDASNLLEQHYRSVIVSQDIIIGNNKKQILELRIHCAMLAEQLAEATKPRLNIFQRACSWLVGGEELV